MAGSVIAEQGRFGRRRGLRLLATGLLGAAVLAETGCNVFTPTPTPEPYTGPIEEYFPGHIVLDVLRAPLRDEARLFPRLRRRYGNPENGAIALVNGARVESGKNSGKMLIQNPAVISRDGERWIVLQVQIVRWNFEKGQEERTLKTLYAHPFEASASGYLYVSDSDGKRIDRRLENYIPVQRDMADTKTAFYTQVCMTRNL